MPRHQKNSIVFHLLIDLGTKWAVTQRITF
jgi:hypothetical protein